MNRNRLRKALARRAHHRCEYCKMHDRFQGATFHIEHCHPSSRDGSDNFLNLCYSCSRCNGRKSDRVVIEVPRSDEMVEIFNPRKHIWAEHFEWFGLRMRAKTILGKAMIAYFGFNSPWRIRIREVEARYGLHPPKRE